MANMRITVAFGKPGGIEERPIACTEHEIREKNERTYLYDE
jgi:hypothetical protein